MFIPNDRKCNLRPGKLVKGIKSKACVEGRAHVAAKTRDCTSIRHYPAAVRLAASGDCCCFVACCTDRIKYHLHEVDQM